MIEIEEISGNTEEDDMSDKKNATVNPVKKHMRSALPELEKSIKEGHGFVTRNIVERKDRVGWLYVVNDAGDESKHQGSCRRTRMRCENKWSLLEG